MSSLNQRKNNTDKPIILHIETSTNVCSVALSKGEQLLVLKESNEDKAHGKLLTVFIQEVLEENKLKPNDLDAVAVSEGPGSYTGLRIGVSTAKGLCYGLQIPLIAVNTLEVLANAKNFYQDSFEEFKTGDLLCPMLDARRMEVYTCFFDSKIDKISEISAEIIDDETFKDNLESKRIFFFGNGSEKCKDTIKSKNAYFIDGVELSGEFMIKKAIEKFHENLFENVAYFEPLYLKDFVPTVSKKKFL